MLPEPEATTESAETTETTDESRASDSTSTDEFKDDDEDVHLPVTEEELVEIYSISENIQGNIEQLEALNKYLEEDQALLIMGNYRDKGGFDDTILVFEEYKAYAAKTSLSKCTCSKVLTTTWRLLRRRRSW